MCGHPENAFAGHSSSTHQRWIQRSPGWLSGKVSHPYSWKARCRKNTGWYWSKVCCLTSVIMHWLTSLNSRIAAVAPFTGLQCFPQGRHFKQWTSDDSKALMKVLPSFLNGVWRLTGPLQVYIAAIEGYVPQDIICTFRAFLEFCYLVRQNVITEPTLTAIEDALTCFHSYREVFWNAQVVATFSLPWQHSMKHYPYLIWQFSAPNGLCSSITESKHIKAVKQPYRHTNCFQALGQMLVINQRLDKFAAEHCHAPNTFGTVNMEHTIDSSLSWSERWVRPM